jgi:glycosyltransferase involved in cell wall biosynthesis
LLEEPVGCADVTVGIVTHNRTAYLKQVVHSLELQNTCKDFKVLIYDVGACSADMQSSACDPIVLDKLKNQLGAAGIDTAIVVSKVPDQYISGARNELIALVTTKYLLFFDDDDIAHADMVSRLNLSTSRLPDLVGLYLMGSIYTIL